MSATTFPGDRVIDGTYHALPDPATDRLLSIVMSLTAEVWTVRDRLRLVEAALAEKGIELGDAIEASRNGPQQLDAMRVDRDAFVERVFVALTSKADAEAP